MKRLFIHLQHMRERSPKIYFLSIFFFVCSLILIFINLNYQKEIIVELDGGELMTMEVDSDYEDPGIIFKIGSKNISDYTYVINNKIKNNELGIYDIDYEITYNGKTYTLSRRVEVVDTVPPEINLNNSTAKLNYCSKKLTTFYDYESIDNYDGIITDKVVREENDNEVLLTSVDSSGNKTIKSITVEKENKPKDSIKLIGNATINLKVDAEYTEEGAKLVDGCGEEIKNVEVLVEGTVDTSTPGKYTITYKANDIEATRTVNVQKKVSTIVSVPNDNVDGNGKLVYLTFDDGPGAYTQGILDLLDKYDAKATFFVTNQFPKYQNMIGEEARRGHSIAVHTYSHQWKIYDSVDSYMSDFNAIEEIIKNQTGDYTKLFRFPGGSSNTVSRGHQKGIMTTLAQKMQEDGYVYFDWNVDSTDAAGGSTKQIIANVTAGMKSSSAPIVLMHDIKVNTYNGLEEILKYGRDHGYKFVGLNTSSPVVHHGINN